MKNETYLKWLNSDKISAELKEELKKMNEEQVEMSFENDLEFGTAGIRGIMGPGTNKLNLITIQKATCGLANYLVNNKKEGNKVAIGYDSRHMSYEFAIQAAEVLSTFNIKSYIYQEVAPTPLLSYLVREKKCDAGIMITASHNPKEYNGYKVYNNTGSQINLQEAEQLIKEVNKIEDILEYNFNAINQDLITLVNNDIFSDYLSSINNIALKKDDLKDISVVFSPMHGTSMKVMKDAFEYFKFNNIIYVTEQMEPDSNFSNAESLNPEEIKAYDLSIEYAKKENADIVVIHDPDADRLGVLYKENNEFKSLTGNQTGALLIDYLVSNVDCKNKKMYQTIVTGELGKKIAQNNQVEVVELLTGFKFIGEQIELLKDSNDFLFGYEESYGYLINSCVRDKDAIQATIVISEMANEYLKNNITLGDKLNSLYEEYGYYSEITHSINLEGIKGQETIKNAMENLREIKLDQIGNYQVTKKIDYLLDNTGLPQSNVIKFELKDLGWFVLRPSGTEPKLKIYISISGNSEEETKKFNLEIFELIKNKLNL